MKTIIAVALVAALVLWLLMGRTTKGMLVTGPTAAKERAEAILADPTGAIIEHTTYAALHPSAESVIDQADSQILRGEAGVADIIRFETELSVYDQYVRAGGTKSFEQFMITDYSSMPAVYKSQIDAAKDLAVQIKADTVLADYTDPANLQHYISQRTEGSAIRAELEKRVAAGVTILPPETLAIAAVSMPEEPAPTKSAEVVSPLTPSEIEVWTGMYDDKEAAETAARMIGGTYSYSVVAGGWLVSMPGEPPPVFLPVEPVEQAVAEVGQVCNSYDPRVGTAIMEAAIATEEYYYEGVYYDPRAV